MKDIVSAVGSAIKYRCSKPTHNNLNNGGVLQNAWIGQLPLLLGTLTRDFWDKEALHHGTQHQPDVQLCGQHYELAKL